MKKKIFNNLILKILSIIVGVLVWIIVTNMNDPVMTRNISGIRVQVTDESVLTEQRKIYEVDSANMYTSVTVSGRRSYVNNLDADDFTATAPLSELSIVNAVPIYVTLNTAELRAEVTITKRADNITVNIENIIDKEYPISVEYTGQPADSYVCDTTKLAEETITVTAPESIHDMINRVTLPISVEGVTSDISDQYEPVLYTSNGRLIEKNSNISFSRKKVQATTTILKKKLVDLNFSVAGEPQDGYRFTDIQRERKQISLVGRENLIDSIDEIVIPASVLNIAGRSENLETTVNMENYIPEGTRIGSEEEKQVKVTVFIVEQEVKTLMLNPETDIKLINIPEGYLAKILSTSEIAVMIRGLDTDMEAITEMYMLDPTVDMAQAKSGENSMPVKFTLPDRIEQIGEITINVRLTEEQTEGTAANRTTVPEPEQ